ncbi:hypothetical protein CR513_45109, partial [Mucuna pruriens]
MAKTYRVYNSRTLKFEVFNPNKELSELTKPFVELNIKELKTTSKKLLLDDEPKTSEAKISSRN